MHFVSSAPSKLILFGEHYVVYGSPALALPIEPRNIVEFSAPAQEGGKLRRAGKTFREGICVRSQWGEGHIGKDGTAQGPAEIGMYAAVARKVFGRRKAPDCTAVVKTGWNIKGTGMSASICASFAAGLFKLAGRKASPGEIFLAAQEGDLAAHGGRASGIDARTVSYGKPLVFTRSFSPPAFEGKEARFSLPEGCSLLVVDTFAGKKDGTSAMVEKFARGFGITAKPHEVGEGKRKEVREEYDGLWKKIVLGLKPDGKTLGGLMNENHALLRERGVSSGGIEKAVSSALAAGALGAKLTGGGGEGGAVIVLCRKKEIARIGREIAEETSFECRKAALADRGAGVD